MEFWYCCHEYYDSNNLLGKKIKNAYLLPLLAVLALTKAVNAQVANYYLLGMAARKFYMMPM